LTPQALFGQLRPGESEDLIYQDLRVAEVAFAFVLGM
jgi:hypothetical protein